MPMEVSNANRSSSRRKKEPTLSYFLYVWRMTDVESKSIRHVSTKVELSSSARYILPIVCVIPGHSRGIGIASNVIRKDLL